MHIQLPATRWTHRLIIAFGRGYAVLISVDRDHSLRAVRLTRRGVEHYRDHFFGLTWE